MFVLSLLLSVSMLAAESAGDLNAKGLRLLQRGRLAEAARTLAQAASVASNELELSMILRNEALVRLRLGETEAAEKRATMALRLAEGTVGEKDPHLTPILNTLAEIAMSRPGGDAEAAEYLDRAVGIGKSAGAHYATALHNCGALAEKRGDAEKARRCFEKALEIRKELLGPNHQATRFSRMSLQRSMAAVRVP